MNTRGRRTPKTHTNRTKPKIKREIKREVKQALAANQEIKIFDVNLSAQSLTAGSTITTLSNPPQGVGVRQRVGDDIELRSLRLNYQIVQLNADIYSDSRIIIFRWYPNTGLASPSLASILDNTAAIGLYSQYSWDTRDQYKILYDRTHSMSGTTAAPTSNSTISVMLHKVHVANLKIQFAAGATTGSNQIFALWISDSVIAPFPLISWSTRLRFTDA